MPRTGYSGNKFQLGQGSGTGTVAIVAPNGTLSGFGLQSAAEMFVYSQADGVGIPVSAAQDSPTGAAGDQLPLFTPSLYNGSTFDARRSNTQGTLLASAARTANSIGTTQTNHNARSLFLFLNVTVASGSGGLTVNVAIVDPISGQVKYILIDSAAITGTGQYVFVVSPGALSGAGADGVRFSRPWQMPRSWRVDVVVGDASSYTYSLSYALTD